jgi:Nuclease-related domain
VELLLSICVGLVIGFLLGRENRQSFDFQNSSEARLSRIVREHFHSPDYHLLNHITLKLEDGTTQIDHILVSRFGVFVIETKDYKGWIFANAKHANWTQVLFNKKFKFQNPIFQNLRHVRAVHDLLDFLPADAVKSLVVFMGEAEFKTEVPDGVFELPGFIEYINTQATKVMSLNRVQFCVGRVETSRLAITGETDVEHIQSLERRHGSAA